MMNTKAPSDGWVSSFEEPSGAFRLIVEDDGSVCYAYLLEGEEIIGDVWLYNVGDNPAEVDWSERARMPFQNLARCCREERSIRFDRTRAHCVWQDERARLFVDEQLWAEVGRGDRPGRSLLAAVASPVARPLSAKP